MGRGDPRCQLHRKSEHAFERQLTLLEDRCEVGALDKLHRDVLHASAFAEIVNARHVAMCDPARHQQLLLEAAVIEKPGRRKYGWGQRLIDVIS
jgi:hypothetical protein